MSLDSGGLELTKLAYTRLEDNLICHRGDLWDVLTRNNKVSFVSRQEIPYDVVASIVYTDKQFTTQEKVLFNKMSFGVLKEPGPALLPRLGRREK